MKRQGITEVITINSEADIHVCIKFQDVRVSQEASTATNKTMVKMLDRHSNLCTPSH